MSISSFSKLGPIFNLLIFDISDISLFYKLIFLNYAVNN